MLTISEAGRKFRDGSLTPERLTDQCLSLIEKENPRLNAFWEVFADDARKEAARAGRELKEGKDRGPLQGIPIGVKDLYDMAGRVTTAGAHPGFHPPPAAEDCAVVKRLREAGAVLIGKTATHEWAMGVSTNNSHFGPTRNPHDTSRIPGGSSGGTAAALAAGLVPGALGSDTGGSIRMPAGLCGVFGLKPTYGSVDMRGVWPLAPSLDTAGPLATTAEDAFLMLEAMSDFRREDHPKPKVYVAKNYFFDEVHPDVPKIVRDAAAKLGPVTEVDVGDAAAAWDANMKILLSEAAELHGERVASHPERFGAGMADRLSGAKEIRGVDFARALKVRRKWFAFLQELLEPANAVLCVPATPVPATVIGDREGAALARVMTRFTAPFNLVGLPILTVPAGRAEGLPIGMQIVAPWRKESALWAMIK